MLPARHDDDDEDEQDMLNTAGEAGINLYTMFLSGLLLMDTPVLATSKNYSSALCRHLMQCRGPIKSDGR